MYIVIIVVVIILVLLFLLSAGRSRSTYDASPPETSKEEKLLDENKQWLEERWEQANREKESGELKTIPLWFFDDVTEHQLRKLEEIGLDITVRGGKMTKGQASDLIGLFEPSSRALDWFIPHCFRSSSSLGSIKHKTLKKTKFCYRKL